MSSFISRLVIGVGSESGNASQLAKRLACDPMLQPYSPRIERLGQLELKSLRRGDGLVIISSSFGDGDPPSTAEGFVERLVAQKGPPAAPYAIFGLGDVAYPHFCGFTKTLDQHLLELGYVPFINRVDADTDYEAFFEIWRKTLLATLHGNEAAGRSLDLQVKSYGASDTFAAPLIEREPLNRSGPHAWKYRLDISGSGINYRAGDNLYVVPENCPDLLSRLGAWFGTDDALDAFSARELRNVGKQFLRYLARSAKSDALRELLKSSNRPALEIYLFGRDILDLLEDFCDRSQMSALEIASELPEIQPRAYSIASCGSSQYVDLCVREVKYSLNGRDRYGAATGFLGRSTSPIPIFARANPRFRLPSDDQTPVIMIGTGTGIGPYMGLLEHAEQCGRPAEACLVFGERRESSDFLYEGRIRKWLANGRVSQLITAFSRDGATPYYVQHALLDNAAQIWRLLEHGAHIYVCGSKANLSQAIEAALHRVALHAGNLTDDLAQDYVARLSLDQRLHKELY